MGRDGFAIARFALGTVVALSLMASPASANDNCPQGNFPPVNQPDYWGKAVAMNAAGTHALVGGWDANGGNGRVRTFVNDGTSWVEKAMLAPDVAFQGGAHFGVAIAMSADGLTAIIGAAGDRHGGAFPFGGSVYIFVRSAGSDTWTKEARLTQPSPGAKYLFGTSVAISDDGSTVAVGQVGNTFEGVPIDSAWTFSRTGTTWSAAQEIVPLVNNESEDFGRSVALSSNGSLVVVGAPGQLTVGPGSAYAFTRSRGAWVQDAKLTASPPVAGGSVGTAVAVAGSQVLVGDPYSQSGSVLVFEKPDATWALSQTIRLPGSPVFSSFGFALAARGEYAMVGAPTSEFNMGQAFLMKRNETGWIFDNRLSPPSDDAVPGDTAQYGSAVAASADATEFVIGAPYLSSGSGVANAGRAYFPDFVTEEVLFDLSDGACNFSLSFQLPGGHTIFLSFDLVGLIIASLNKGCEEAEEFNSYVITDIDFSTLQKEVVVEWSPTETLVFTDLHATLVQPGAAIMPDFSGLGLADDYKVAFSANLRVSETEVIPMNWTTDITTTVDFDVIDGVSRIKIPQTSGSVTIDLGFGEANPVANYFGSLLAIESTAPPCIGDLNGDGDVGAPDIAILLGEWGVRGSAADFDQNGVVAAPDLALLLGAWGPCPE